MVGNIIADAILYAVPLLFAVILHEVAHGWVAEKRGDPTARMMGRITLNPISHIDLVGTVILPLILLVTKSPFLFGWAKPVPVNFANLKGGRRDMALVSLAGPMTNFLLACISALVFRSIQGGHIAAPGQLDWVLVPLRHMTLISVEFNLVLMVINLMPIPPLDGGHILMGVLPYSLASKLESMERYGLLIVLLLIGTGLWGYVVRPVVYTFVRLFLY
ncbi:site-2 protease family protein [Desulforhabdus amnigena]|uniref:Peptidase M50 n=1 Tax=Desulforhabdus amnigena TaxID=40218 RepID=A0A9W6D221_9BACT|nr:site-2 protease family protein [Desulforhabdus amnigena]GLI32802.1 peptidase M50 [Desulforhabdus amnigena]